MLPCAACMRRIKARIRAAGSCPDASCGLHVSPGPARPPRLHPERPSYNASIRAQLADAVRVMAENGTAAIDGAYLIVTKEPCVDGRLVRDPQTHAQRKAARKAAASGGFPGFVSL